MRTEDTPKKHWLKKGEFWGAVIIAIFIWLVPMTWWVRAIGFCGLEAVLLHFFNRTDVADDIKKNSRYWLTAISTLLVVSLGFYVVRMDYRKEHIAGQSSPCPSTEGKSYEELEAMLDIPACDIDSIIQAAYQKDTNSPFDRLTLFLEHLHGHRPPKKPIGMLNMERSPLSPSQIEVTPDANGNYRLHGWALDFSGIKSIMANDGADRSFASVTTRKANDCDTESAVSVLGGDLYADNRNRNFDQYPYQIRRDARFCLLFDKNKVPINEPITLTIIAENNNDGTRPLKTIVVTFKSSSSRQVKEDTPNPLFRLGPGASMRADGIEVNGLGKRPLVNASAGAEATFNNSHVNGSIIKQPEKKSQPQ